MKTRFLAAFAGFGLVLTALIATPANAGTLDMGIGPDQSEIDSMDGGWASSQIGIAGRPFVQDMYLDSVHLMHADEPGLETWDAGKENWRLLVNPNNVCRSNQTPSPGVCYSDPNRVTFSLAYIHNGNTYNDFSGATLSNLGIDENSEFEFDINLNTMQEDLGWTWLSGVPTYWELDNEMVIIAVKPAIKPSTHQIDEHCSTIPVSTCDTNQAADEIFTIEFVMSFDDTLNSVFDGTLFASEGAVIASLETAPGFDPVSPDANSITYGMAAPHLNADGSARNGTFYALLTDEQLAVFGVTDPATVSDTLKITRSSSDSGTFDASWSEWTAGSTGRLLTISNISFSVPKFTVNNGAQVERAVVPKVKVKKLRVTKKLLVDLGILSANETLPRGAKVTIIIKAASKKICKATKTGIQGLKVGTCKYTIKVKAGSQATSKSGSFKVIK